MVKRKKYLERVRYIFRSSHWRCSVRKGAVRNSQEITGKHLCQSLFLNKVAGNLQEKFRGEFRTQSNMYDGALC